MLTLKTSKLFRTEIKKIKNRELLNEIKEVIDSLAEGQQLDSKYYPHPLSGNYRTYTECHIRPDLLLIYKVNNQELELYLYRLGSHSELFNK